MAILGINFDEVPDKFVPVRPGDYTGRIESVVIEDVKNENNDPKKAGKQNVVVKIRINKEGSPEFDRVINDYISLEMKTKIKNLYHSTMGRRPGSQGFDEQELVGGICRFFVEANVYTNNAGQKVENTRIKEYVIPAD